MESELREGYKMTEQGALPEEWEVTKLGDICNIKMGQSPPSSSYNDNSNGLPFFQGNADFGTKFPTIRYYCNEPLKIADIDDILMSVRAPVGALNISNVRCCIGRGLTAINADKNNSQTFMYYLLQSCVGILNKFATGSTFTAINQKELNMLLIAHPPLPEQRRIATILSTLDETVEHTEALIEKYKNIKAGLMSDLLTRGIDEGGRIRSEETHRFKDSALGRVPEEWEMTFLGKCCKKITDGSHFSPVPTKDGPKIANVKDIFGKNINIKSCTSISNEDFIKLEKGGCSPNRGDVLLSKDGTIGKTLVYEQDEKIVLLSSIAIIKPKDNLNSYFLHNIFKSFYFDKQMLILISGSALRRVVLRDINLIRIPLPPLQEQRRIAEILTAADQRIEKEEAYRDKLLQLKKGLMQDLLTGKVRVK